MGDCELDGLGSIGSASDDMLQECCGVIEQTVEQDRITQRGGKPPVVVYEWLEGLSKGDWFSALILSKKSGDGDQAVATSIDGIDTTTASANPDITSVL